jgi:type IV pilus assembly protein PilM
MIKLGRKTDEAVGLDIGSHSIKVTSIRKEVTGNIFSAYNIKRIPLNEKNPKLEAAIDEALKEIDLHPSRVNLSVSGANVIVRFINLPKMNIEQLENALTFEADKYIPFDVSEVVMDFLILGDAPEPGQMRVLLAAARRESVESKVKLVERIGLSVKVMDIDSFAMFNAFTEANPAQEETGKALIDLGHTQTNVLISIGKQPCFMRQIQIGGKDITEAVSKSAGVPFSEAEELKLKGEEGPSGQISVATSSVLDDLVREIQLSFGYFDNRFGKSVGEIFCSGGVTYQKGVLESLGDKVGIQVKSWNPAKGMKIAENLSVQDIDVVGPQLAVSIGLALRG